MLVLVIFTASMIEENLPSYSMSKAVLFKAGLKYGKA
jgi:hypothetical protein